MTLIAKNINNINQNFETKLVQIGGVTDKIYIQPKDKTTKIPVENLYWKNWSRAGLYRYDTTPNVLPENIKLGETPSRMLNQSTVLELEMSKVVMLITKSQILYGHILILHHHQQMHLKRQP